MTTQDSKLTLATRITIARILGVPAFILALLYYTMSVRRGEPVPGFRYAALCLFVLVAVTDALDGFVARSRDEITRLGSMLDPLADKALLLSGLLLLTRPSLPQLEPQFPVPFTLLVVSRDAVCLLGSAIIHAVTGHLDVNPRVTGKVATFFMMLCLAWALAAGPTNPFLILVGVAALFTLVSGIQYIFDGIRQLERPSPSSGAS